MRQTIFDKPWRTEGAFQDAGKGIPKMMRPAECQMLYHIAKDVYSGSGEIVDSGVLVGASTASLAAGLAENDAVADKARRIHSYDLFINVHPVYDAFVRNQVARNESFLPLYLKNIGEHASNVNVHAGDFTAQRWCGKKIEVMFIDLAKNLRLNSHIFSEFAPYWTPGETTVIQQDFVHLFCPFIQYTTAFLWDHFSYADTVVPSLALRYEKEIPKWKVERIADDDFTWDEKAGLCLDLAPQIANEEAQATLKLIAATMVCYGGDKKKALDLVQHTEDQHAGIDDKYYRNRIADARNLINAHGA